MAAVGDEKIGDVDVRQAGLSSSSSDRPAPTGVNSDAASGGSKVDAAWKFLNEHRDVDVDDHDDDHGPPPPPGVRHVRRESSRRYSSSREYSRER